MFSILKSLAQKEIAISMVPAPCVDCLVLWLADNRRAKEAIEVSAVLLNVICCLSLRLCSVRGFPCATVLSLLLSITLCSEIPLFSSPLQFSAVHLFFYFLHQRYALFLSFSISQYPFLLSQFPLSLPLTPTPFIFTDPRSPHDLSPRPPLTSTKPGVNRLTQHAQGTA